MILSEHTIKTNPVLNTTVIELGFFAKKILSLIKLILRRYTLLCLFELAKKTRKSLSRTCPAA